MLLLLLLLLQRSTEHKRASYFHAFVRSSLHLFIFFRLGLFYFIFGLSLPRALGGGGGDGVRDHACRRPTHLMGPLVDDHFIYCNITHTRTINERRRPKWRTKGRKKMLDGRLVLALEPAASSRFRRSETIDPRINRTNWGATCSNECTDLLREKEWSRDRCSFESTSIDRRITLTVI